MIAGLFREARPKQWVKNLLVFAAPAAAGALDSWPILWRATVAFIAFCLASSGTYFWNDIHDVEADRRHPKKRTRPVASGAVPIGVAKVVGTVLLMAGIGLAFVVHWQLGLVVLGYVVLAWRAAGYGALQMIREMVTASTLLVIGLQTMFGGFLLSVIGGNEAHIIAAVAKADGRRQAGSQ